MTLVHPSLVFTLPAPTLMPKHTPDDYPCGHVQIAESTWHWWIGLREVGEAR